MQKYNNNTRIISDWIMDMEISRQRTEYLLPEWSVLRKNRS